MAKSQEQVMSQCMLLKHKRFKSIYARIDVRRRSSYPAIEHDWKIALLHNTVRGCVRLLRDQGRKSGLPVLSSKLLMAASELGQLPSF